MKHILYILSMLIATVTYAQQGINYKAILKDNNGNVMSNISIDVELIIKVGTTQTTTYEEAHTTTTDANGVFILSIGEGMPSTGFDFNDVDWASDDHFLQVFVDDGNDLLDFGTTAFQKVPYAIQADKATLAENVSGLELITENSVSGWRLIGKDPDNYGDTGINAIDLSTSSISSTLNGATGNTAMTSGFNTKASGAYATAMGFTTEATQTASTALGDKSKANGNSSLAFGNQSEASGFASVAGGTSSKATGNSSVALGYNADADAFRSAAFGSYNTGGGNPDSWQATDPIFQVGNGQSINSKSNALTILKDGTITAPSFDIAEIIDDKALITKEYFEANQPSIPEAPSGLEQITENDGSQDNTGWRLKGVNPNNYAPIGGNALDLSFSPIASATVGASGLNSIAMGYQATASGANSLALGFGTIASDARSVAIGLVTTASNDNSTAMGSFTLASGYNSTAMGGSTTASGANSTTMGVVNEAPSYAETAIGSYCTNYTPNSTSIWNESDRLFVIGNGTSIDNRSDALTILKNGQHTINSSRDGLKINAGNDVNDYGIEIFPVGASGVKVRNPSFHGVDIDNPGANGISISGSASDGIYILNGDNGIKVVEARNYGGYFEGADGGAYVTSAFFDYNPDITLGGNSNTTSGDDGIISSDPEYTGSDIILKSNDNVFVDLDRSNNGSTTSSFRVRDGNNNAILEVEDNGRVGIGDATPDVELDVIGSIHYTGSITDVSDRRLKENFKPLSNALSDLVRINGYSYNMKNDANKEREYGVIAQELQNVFPEMVDVVDKEKGYLGVSYTQLIPVLLEAIKEQQQIIDSERTINRKNKELILGLLVRVEALENQKAN